MNKYSFNDDKQSIKHVISRLSDDPHLSDWEKGFIGSIKKNEGGSLSVKQLQKLSDLWEKY